MKFNVNEYVWVKLSATGIAELNMQSKQLEDATGGKYKSPEIKIDESGYTKFQMRDLMNRLGHLCSIGFETPFHPDIMLKEPKEKEGES